MSGKADDLISRQQATKEMYDLCEYINCESLHIDVIVDTLENLPSTEPEIIRCKECKYAHLTYDGKCKYCDNWTDEYEIPEELYLDGDFYCGYAERRENE